MNAQPLFSRAKLFFFVSGLTALTYEVVWVRLLGLVFGNTTYAISTVLSAYMAGLGFGSYFIGRAAEKWKRPLRTYGILEACVALYAALTLPILKGVQAIYLLLGRDLEPSSTLSISLKLFLAFFVVFVPTFCMGGTLPVLIKFFLKTGKSVGATTATLYGVNTAGAVAGTALTGFFFLPVFGVRGTLVLCVALNLLVAGLALLWSTRSETPAEPAVRRPAAEGPRANRWILGGLFISGITAMLYEVGWTRILAVVLGSSTYAFTLMLSTFLMGLALGSALFQKVLNRRAATGLDWVWLQLALSATAMASLPLFPWVDIMVVRLHALTIGHTNAMFILLGLVCMFFIMLPTLAFGALFAASASLYADRAPDASRRIGLMYLCNTFGNILGSLAAGFWLIPNIGILPTLLWAVGIGATLSAAGAWLVAKKAWQNSSVFLLSAAVLVSVGSMGSEGWDRRLLSSGLHINPGLFASQNTEKILSRLFNHHILSYRDGLNCTVAVGQDEGTRYLKVNGKTDASSAGDMPTQLLIGHLPLLLHPDPHRVLVIGFGSGVTVSTSVAHPIQEVECVEIESAVIDAAPYFESVHRNAYKDPRIRIVLNDGRNHLLMQEKKYDVISSEPSNPWMAGISYLFTTDFYRLVSSRLNDDGVFCQWLQAYATSPQDFWMVIASVRSVFPHVTLWRSMQDDFMIIAQKKPFEYDVERIQKRFEESPRLRQDLKPYEITGAVGLLGRFQLGEASLARLTEGSPLHDDDRLSLEFSSPYALYRQNDVLLEDIAKAALKEPLPVTLETKESFTELGEAYLGMMNNVSKAKEYFNKALALDPEYGPALAGLGRCLGNENKNLQAMSYLERSGTVDGYSFLGRAYYREGDFTKAAELLAKAESMEPEYWEHLYWKAQALEALSRWQESLDAYRKCALLLPKNLTIELAIGRVLRKSGDLEGAVTQLESVKKEYPTHYPVYAELRTTYVALDRLGTITADFERLVQVNPHFKQYWVDLIGLYIKRGDEERLQEVLNESAKRTLY